MENNNFDFLSQISLFMEGDEITTFIDSQINQEIFWLNKKILKLKDKVYLKLEIKENHILDKESFNQLIYKDFNSFIKKNINNHKIFWFFEIPNTKQSLNYLKQFVLDFNRSFIKNPENDRLEPIEWNLKVAFLVNSELFSDSNTFNFFINNSYLVHSDSLKDMEYV